MQIDLGQSRKIDMIKLLPMTDGGGWGLNVHRAFQLRFRMWRRRMTRSSARPQ